MLLASPQMAVSGAWTLAEGDGQLILTTGRNAEPMGAWVAGLADHDKSSVYIFVEYGLTETLTLGASASGEWTATTNHADLRLGGHARYRLWQGRAGDVFSIQLGGSGPVQDWFGDPLLVGTDDNVAEAEAGLLYGRGWVSDWGDSFFSIRTGYRWRNGRPDEMLFETTAGHAVSRRLMGLFGAFIARPMGDGAEASLKLAPSVAWTLWPRLGPNDKKPAEFRHPSTIEFGASYDIVNPEDGLGFYVSIWNRF